MSLGRFPLLDQSFHSFWVRSLRVRTNARAAGNGRGCTHRVRFAVVVRANFSFGAFLFIVARPEPVPLAIPAEVLVGLVWAARDVARSFPTLGPELPLFFAPKLQNSNKRAGCREWPPVVCLGARPEPVPVAIPAKVLVGFAWVGRDVARCCSRASVLESLVVT